MRSGENNSNFGKRWTEEQRIAASILKKSQYATNPEYAYNVGKSNRGVKFSEDRIASMHRNRNLESYKHYPSEEVKKIIGQKSKEKWTADYKEKYRKTMEVAGYWVPKDKKDPYDIYYKEANWIDSMIDHFDTYAKQNLVEHGIFGKQNPKGWVRDHIVSRMIGFEFDIPAFIIRHPANMQFISHADNIKKGFSDRQLTKLDKENIIAQLITRIQAYKLDWKEQSKCLDYIRNKNENLDNQ